MGRINVAYAIFEGPSGPNKSLKLSHKKTSCPEQNKACQYGRQIMGSCENNSSLVPLAVAVDP